MSNYRRSSISRIASWSVFITLVATNSNVNAQPPESERDVVVDDYFGTTIEDPYRWLEGGDLIEDETLAKDIEARVAEWTDAQNVYTRSILDNLPGRAELESRTAELMEVDWIGVPSMYGSMYFYKKRTAKQNQSVLYVQEGIEDEPRVLLDPNSLDSEGLTSLAWTAPSPDGSLLAFGLDYAGAELPTLYLMDVETGRWLADEIPSDAGSVSWLPDSSGFLYQVRADVEDAYSARVKFHVVGRHHRQDPVLIKQEGTTWGPFAYFSNNGRWIIAGNWTSTRSNDLWVVDADHWRRTGEFAMIPIAVGLDARFFGTVYGDVLYMHTTLEAPNSMIYAVDLNRPDRGNWTVVLPERKDATLEGVGVARGILVAQYLHRAYTQMTMHDLQGQKIDDVNLPGIGSASIATSDDRTEAFVSYSSFNEPQSIYRIDLRTNNRELWARPDVPVDPDSVVVKQVEYESKDGTAISMFLVHKEGLELNGNNPTVLYGYGGFNQSMTPYFSRTRFLWYDRGGVYAIPNLRGGGEYGEAWHRAGMLKNKQNTYDDFIAAAEWLIDEGYTNPDRLAIAGGSNGGLLTGAVLVQRPELFGAVISAVPLLDMLRYQYFLMARYWVPEYGSAEVEEQFEFLRETSPYQNINHGVAYPSVFLTAGENDARVHPAHARKMAAALQHATTSDPSADPILLWVDREAGHGSGKPLDHIVRDIVDQYVYLMWQLDMMDDE